MRTDSILIPIISFTASGGSRALCRFASEWVRAGTRVAFLVLDPKSSPAFQTAAEVIYCQTLDPTLSKAIRADKIGLAYDIVSLSKAIRALDRSFSVLLASHGFTALACRLAGKSHRTMYYVQAYDPEVLVRKGTLSGWVAAGLTYSSYWLCRNQVVNSPHYLEYSGISATLAIPPGVDTNVFIAKPEPGPLASEVRVGIIGRAEAHKYRPVLSAYRDMQKVHPQCRLLIAYGNIPQDALSDCGEYEIVHPTNDAELAAFYRSCDVFLALTELPQGVFYPPLESLASGTSLISNRFYLVSESNSWVVESSDGVASAFSSWLASPSLRRERARQGIEDVRNFLNWETLAMQLGKAIDDLVSSRTHARVP